jgi:hypothetical protein
MPPCPIDDAGIFTNEVPEFVGLNVKVSFVQPFPKSTLEFPRSPIKAFENYSRKKED